MPYAISALDDLRNRSEMNPYTPPDVSPGEQEAAQAGVHQVLGAVRAREAQEARQRAADERAQQQQAAKLKVDTFRAKGYATEPDPVTGEQRPALAPDGGNLLKHPGHTALFTSESSGGYYALDPQRKLVPAAEHPETISKTDEKTGKIVKHFHGTTLPGDFGEDPGWKTQQAAKQLSLVVR